MENKLVKLTDHLIYLLIIWLTNSQSHVQCMIYVNCYCCFSRNLLIVSLPFFVKIINQSKINHYFNHDNQRKKKRLICI